MKNLLRLTTLITLTLILKACSFTGTSKTPLPEIKAANFDYTPPTTENQKPNDIKIAIINPKFIQSFSNANEEPFLTFSKNMSMDFVELLNARGYQYIGPLASYDELVYNDKKTTDLVMDVDIDINMTPLYLKSSYKTNYSDGTKTNYYWAEGTSTITGKVNLNLYEPFTKTKLWSKSITIDPTKYTVVKSLGYYTKEIPLTDPIVYNALTPALETIYKNTLQTAWNHLDPNELQVLKKQSIEIKNNSSYSK